MNNIYKLLADNYPHVYIAPCAASEEEYRAVVLKGQPPKDTSLSHFKGSPDDDMWLENTPAGDVRIAYIEDRSDFETLVRILAYKCAPKAIPATTGAIAIRGIINRGKINEYQEKCINSGKDNWRDDYKKFIADKSNYLDTIIVISKGSYSGINPEDTFDKDKWLDISKKIRIYHECTHIICRRLFPEKKDAVKDEVVADAIGLIGALGYYDKELAKLFLGVDSDGYTGGRLENYVSDGDINIQAKNCNNFIERVYSFWNENKEMKPYDFLINVENELFN